MSRGIDSDVAFFVFGLNDNNMIASARPGSFFRSSTPISKTLAGRIVSSGSFSFPFSGVMKPSAVCCKRRKAYPVVPLAIRMTANNKALIIRQPIQDCFVRTRDFTGIPPIVSADTSSSARQYWNCVKRGPHQRSVASRTRKHQSLC